MRILTLISPFMGVLASCAGSSSVGEELVRTGDEIVAAGRFIHTGTPVVLWLDPGGYDAYRLHRHFEPAEKGPSGAPDRTARFGSLRYRLPDDLGARVAEYGWSLDDLREAVRQVVVHFDACGTSRECFRVLHDVRGLSCHFLLDVDGTIYQTLDLKERAWHAAQANEYSVGIEIAHIGAKPSEADLAPWYATSDDGAIQLTIPEAHRPRLESYAGGPSRPGLFRGVINGREVVQYDFTEEQYVALEKLLLALCRTFPRVRARVPRTNGGEVAPNVLPSDEAVQFEGLIAHSHVSDVKVDPGPAFDWDRILRSLRRAGIEE